MMRGTVLATLSLRGINVIAVQVADGRPTVPGTLEVGGERFRVVDISYAAGVGPDRPQLYVELEPGQSLPARGAEVTQP